MMYSNTLHRQKVRKRKLFSKRHGQREIKRILPAGSKFPTIRGKWESLGSGQIRAWYTPEEYAQCRKMFKLIKDARPLRSPTSEDK
jgi:hypothetical protein